VVLKHYEGYSYQEIAQILETSPKAVERVLAKACGKLQGLLTEWIS